MHDIYIAVDCSCAEHYDPALGDPMRLASRVFPSWSDAGEYAHPWIQWANGHAGAAVSAHDGMRWSLLAG